MKYLVLLMGVLCLSILPCAAQYSAMNITAVQLAKATVKAQNSLAELPLLAQQINVKSLGFDSREQVKMARLGTPIADYMVYLSELKEYQTERPAAELLHATGRLIYPLKVNQNVQSAVTVTTDKESWKLESFGASQQIRQLAEQRTTFARTEGHAEKDLFQVRIPALQLMFVGLERTGKIYLAPLYDMPLYGLKKGTRYSAEQVFKKLVDAARKHNGEPT